MPSEAVGGIVGIEKQMSYPLPCEHVTSFEPLLVL